MSRVDSLFASESPCAAPRTKAAAISCHYCLQCSGHPRATSATSGVPIHMLKHWARPEDDASDGSKGARGDGGT